MTDLEKKEQEFLDTFDCKFPYLDIKKREGLIDQALKISSNAVYAIVEEVARVPVSERVNISHKELFNILDYIDERFEHPLKEKVFQVARLMIVDKELSVEKAIELMQEVRGYEGEYSALNVVYFSCDDVEGKVEVLDTKIRQEWQF